MKTYYFSEASPADAAGDAVLLPVTSFLSMDVVDSKNVDLLFKKINGTHGNTKSNVIDIVEAANRHPLGVVLAETSSLITAITIAE